MARKVAPRRKYKDDVHVTESSEPRRVVAYARVSSKDQEREGFSIPAQQRLLSTYAEQHGLVIAQEFIDVETAKKAGRTNFDAMLAWLKKNQKTCRTILVEKTDRLYRNLKDWVVLDELDIEIHLVKENVVLSDDARSTDKFMHGIRVLMAKNYIDNLREEVTKGMNEKAAQGFWPSTAPYGYRNVTREDGKRIIVPDAELHPAVHRLFELAATGLSLSEIRKRLAKDALVGRRSKRPLTRSAIHRILRNPIYMGEYDWRGRRCQGVHTPLVDRGLWERVQLTIDDRYRLTRDTIHVETFAFTGFLKCGHCGCAMSAQLQKERYIYYHCTGYKGACGEPYVREEVLDAAFKSALERVVLPEGVHHWLIDGLRQSATDQEAFHRESVDRLQTECTKLQRRVDQAYTDRLDGTLTTETWRRLNDQWNEELRAHRRTIAHHEDAKRSYMEDGIALVEVSREAPYLFEMGSRDQKRKVLKHLVSNSTWANGKLEVEFKNPFGLFAEYNDGGPDEHHGGDVPPEVLSRRVSLTGQVSNWLAQCRDADFLWLKGRVVFAPP